MKLINPLTHESEIRDSFSKSLLNRNKEIIKIQENYLPCYLFKLEFRSAKKTKSLYVICDAVRAKVRRVNWPQSFHSNSRDFPDYALDQDRALRRVKEELKWGAMTSRLKIKKKYRLDEVSELGKIGYPFWIVYFKRRRRYNFLVYDALSGKREDFFGKDIFLELFGLANDASSKASTNTQPDIDIWRK